MKRILKLLLMLLLVLTVAYFALASISITKKLNNLDSQLRLITSSVQDAVRIAGPASKNNSEPEATNTSETNVEFRVRGVIRKEPIPRELDLGEYRYIFYFDEPFLVEQNASGIPQYVNIIEARPVEQRSFEIDDFANKRVEVAGYLGWGYAESRIINIIAIALLK